MKTKKRLPLDNEQIERFKSITPPPGEFEKMVKHFASPIDNKQNTIISNSKSKSVKVNKIIKNDGKHGKE